MFKMYATETLKTYIGTYYIALIDPQKDTITVKPLRNHINCETIEKY